jgi:hypothetical protein
MLPMLKLPKATLFIAVDTNPTDYAAGPPSPPCAAP